MQVPTERAPRAFSASEKAPARAAHPCSLRWIPALAVCFALACGADPKTVEGALAAASAAVAARDHAALLQALDERARFSIASIHHARKTAAAEIRASYPAEAQAQALRELGDALTAETDVDLFRARCGDGCLESFAAVLGAPRETRVDGRITTVTTARDTEAQLYRADDGRYGLVWESEALMRERTRAAAELDLIRKNGVAYRAQRALSEGAR